jgi:Flp pilus assembly protein TadG
VSGTGGREAGGIAIEAAVLVPSILLFVLMAVAAGRVETAGSVVDEAARVAARSASLARTVPEAQAAANAAAADTLAQQGVNCATTPAVSVDTSQFEAPLGQMGYVTVTVECTVPLGDLVVPGLPGSDPMTGRFTSVVDSYRAR